MNLQSIIVKSGLRPQVVAAAIYPELKNPYHALRRDINENRPLSVQRISNLAKLLRTPIEVLLDMTWKGSYNDHKVILSSGDYQATYCTDTNYLTVEKNGEVIGEDAFLAPCTVKQFKNKAIEIITKHIS